MSDCRRTVEALAGYVDGQLVEDVRAGVDRHLRECPRCRALAGDVDGGRRVLRSRAEHLLAGPLPPGLHSRCTGLASQHRPGARLALLGPWWRVRLVPALLTLLVLTFSATALFTLATRRSTTVLAAQLTADHSKCFRLFGPEEASSDVARVERMLSGRYGWDVHVPPSSPADEVELLGARRCLYGDGLVPHVMYRVRGQEVSLFVLHGTARSEAELVTLGHRARIWARGSTTYVLVSPDADGGMTRAARYVMRETR